MVSPISANPAISAFFAELVIAVQYLSAYRTAVREEEMQYPALCEVVHKLTLALILKIQSVVNSAHVNSLNCVKTAVYLTGTYTDELFKVIIDLFDMFLRIFESL